jgi:hypothetical protein
VAAAAEAGGWDGGHLEVPAVDGGCGVVVNGDPAV